MLSVFVILQWIQAATAQRVDLSLVPLIKGVESPTQITHAGDGTGRLFILEQKGRILVFGGKDFIERDVFMDLSGKVACCGERGLLGVAFPPSFKASGEFYVHYSDARGNTTISRFKVSRGSSRGEMRSEEVLLSVKQPFSNHNGGQIAFGPDGYLYVALGDGGSGGDPLNNAQNSGSLLGKILRLDVGKANVKYAIPLDNPFNNGGQGGREEIWAMGLRNPWRFSFDRVTGDLYIADVGQNRYEEVNFEPATSKGGRNYGWKIMEGSHCFGAKKCEHTNFTLPVLEYAHDLGCSVTGGLVYRGSKLPALRGTYIYGDFCSGRIWGASKGNGFSAPVVLLDTDISISTFGDDEMGELYVADYRSGTIYRLELH